MKFLPWAYWAYNQQCFILLEQRKNSVYEQIAHVIRFLDRTFFNPSSLFPYLNIWGVLVFQRQDSEETHPHLGPTTRSCHSFLNKKDKFLVDTRYLSSAVPYATYQPGHLYTANPGDYRSAWGVWVQTERSNVGVCANNVMTTLSV